MRPTLFRLASDTEDNDEALGERAVGLMIEVTFSPSETFHGTSHIPDLNHLAPVFSAYSGYLTGQRQPDTRHQPVQTAGQGGGHVEG